jgi:hypothetical protein
MIGVVKNWVRRNIHGSGRAKVMGDRKNSIRTSFIIFAIYHIFTSKRMIWVGHLTCVEGKKCIITGFWYQNLQEIIIWKTWTQVGGYLIRSLGNRVRGLAVGFFLAQDRARLKAV